MKSGHLPERACCAALEVTGYQRPSSLRRTTSGFHRRSGRQEFPTFVLAFGNTTAIFTATRCVMVLPSGFFGSRWCDVFLVVLSAWARCSAVSDWLFMSSSHLAAIEIVALCVNHRGCGTRRCCRDQSQFTDDGGVPFSLNGSNSRRRVDHRRDFSAGRPAILPFSSTICTVRRP